MENLSSLFIKGLTGIVSVYILLYLLVQALEYQSLYHPVRLKGANPSAFLYQEHPVRTMDGETIFLWWFENPKATFTLLLCHGNAGNNSHRIDQILMWYQFGYSVAIFDYRGYGQSSGHPSEKGLYLDGQATMRYLNENLKIPYEKIVVLGTSLGAAVAIELALQFPMHALILETAFTSKHAMAKQILPFFPVEWFSRNQYDNLSKIRSVSVPVLITHGTNDEIVPYFMSLELYEAASGKKFHYPVQGAHHNDLLTVGGKNYFSRLHNFIQNPDLH